MSAATDGSADMRRGRRARTVAIGLALVGLGALAFAVWAVGETAEAASPAAGRSGDEFSAFIDDLPIMPGLAENDEGYAFDLFQGGRLAEARLAGQVEPAVVRGFYAAALAQLGWQVSDTEPYVYHRAGERLMFLVEPRRAKGRGRAPRGHEAVFVVTPQSRLPASASTGTAR